MPSESGAVVHCRELSLREVRRLHPIPSEYSTDRVYHLSRHAENGAIQWTLREARLPHVFEKRYDSGRADEWLEANADAGPARNLRFLGAEMDGQVCGVATWREVNWNFTLWLVDLRVERERRRHGVGAAMMAWLRQEAVRRRLRGITVETQTANAPAVSFYRAQGFTIAGFHEALYSNRDVESGEVALFLFAPVH